MLLILTDLYLKYQVTVWTWKILWVRKETSRIDQNVVFLFQVFTILQIKRWTINLWKILKDLKKGLAEPPGPLQILADLEAKTLQSKYLLLMTAKGQLISKCLFGAFNFSQKTNENKSTWGIIVVKLNSFFYFLEEIDDPQNF